MRVLLSKDVKDLGKAGDIVEVSEGYARNFLMPRHLATEATAGALKQREEQQKSQAAKQAKLKAEAEELAKRLETKTVTLEAKAGEGGRLYGAVTAKEIAQETKRQTGIEVDKRKIDLEEPIRALGHYNLTVRVHPEVSAKLRVQVAEGK